MLWCAYEYLMMVDRAKRHFTSPETYDKVGIDCSPLRHLTNPSPYNTFSETLFPGHCVWPLGLVSPSPSWNRSNIFNFWSTHSCLSTFPYPGRRKIHIKRTDFTKRHTECLNHICQQSPTFWNNLVICYSNNRKLILYIHDVFHPVVFRNSCTSEAL